jgi:hypothetical protein
MELQNNIKRKSWVIYITIVVFTFFINIPIYMYLTWHYISSVGNYISNNIPFLYIHRPSIFTIQPFAIDLMLNVLQLLIIEFVIVFLFHIRLNNLFKIDNLFTIKKFILLMVIVVGLQMAFSYWIWRA